jgi:hypothetical protein
VNHFCTRYLVVAVFASIMKLSHTIPLLAAALTWALPVP